MKIKIFQINHDRDTHRVKFVSLLRMKKYSGLEAPDASIYDFIWEGVVPAATLDDVYCIFNSVSSFPRPEDFRGHSLSVSDIVEVVSEPDYHKPTPWLNPGFYYCDSFGWQPVPFDPAEAGVKPEAK